MLYESLELVGDGEVIRRSVVDVASLTRENMAGWPDIQLLADGHEWRAWTWLGWSLVCMWKQGTND